MNIQLTNRKKDILIAAVLAVFYLAFSDGLYSYKDRALFAQTAAIAEHGQLHLNGILFNKNFLPQFQGRRFTKDDGTEGDVADYFSGDSVRIDGRVYPLIFPGVSICALPPYFIMHLLAGCSFGEMRHFTFVDRSPDGFSSSVISGWPIRLSIFLSAGIFTVISALLILRITDRLLGGGGTLAAVLYGLCSLNAFYATAFFQRQLAASLFVISFWIIFDLAEKLDLRGAIAAAFFFSFGAFSSYPDVVLIIPFALFAIKSSGWRRASQFATAALAMSFLMIALYNLSATGHPLKLPHSFAHANKPELQRGFEGLGIIPDLSIVILNLFDLDRGMFVYTPYLLLAVPGLVIMYRSESQQKRSFALFAVLVLVCLMWVYSTYEDWRGGVSFGQRYILPTIPFLTVAAAAFYVRFSTKILAKAPFILLAVLSFAVIMHGLLSKRQYFLGGDSIVKTVLYQIYFAGKDAAPPPKQSE